MTIRALGIKLTLVGVVSASMFAYVGLLVRSTQAQTTSLIWYVDRNCTSCGRGTFDQPFQTINKALAAADNGDTILVAQGIYTENLLINAQVTLMGGYSPLAGTGVTTWTRCITRCETTITSDDRTIPGEWNGDWIGALSIIKDDHAYRMWYSAGNEIEGESIGYADSPDGVNWFQPCNYSLLGPGTLGAWDEASAADPAVLITGVGLQMWYVGSDVFGQRAIGYASSLDGLTWTKYEGNPILRPDSTDADSFGYPTVVQDGSGNYGMWYSGGGRIWFAVSSDGLNWSKYVDNPVLSPGLPGDWDDGRVYAPVVFAGSDKYEMWYVGESAGASEAQIGYAWSSNGFTWTKSLSNPVLIGCAECWENATVANPAVIAEGMTSYKMWYRGGDSDLQAIGQAVSTDGLNWMKHDNNPVLTQGRPTHWGRPVVYFGSESSGAVVDGFTISNGYSDYGGGIFAYETSPIIRACRVTRNTAHYAGGGIWVGNGTPLIVNTVVSSNTSSKTGGGIVASYASPTIQESVVANNASRNYGGGMSAMGAGQSTLVATTISHNTARWGGGLYGGNADLHASSCRIDGNSAEQGAGIRVTYATLAVTNTFVVDNYATGDGPGGIQFWQASGRLANATIAGNGASTGSGGIVFGTGDPAKQLVVFNSILFFNDGSDLSCSGGACSVTYSDVQEGFSGSGNISADPRFVDQTGGDYHLRGNSPAIDAGTSEGAPATDFEGDLRPIGGVDMGADEFSDELIDVYLPLVLREL
jgi:hypothetical protein